MFRRMMMALLVTGGALVWACASDHVTGLRAGQGMLAMKLTDAPLPLDSVKAVNVFVERIDARRARTDSTMRDVDLDDEHEETPAHVDSTLWVTIATPDSAFNLLDLQNGVTAFLGKTPVDTGTFRAVRLVIDPAKCTIVLKDGTVLSASSTPPVEFENSHRHGLMVELNDSLDVRAGSTTTLVLDLKLGSSISLRGTSVHDGFFFRPVIVGQQEGHENGDH
jgi:hypothetical protein